MMRTLHPLLQIHLHVRDGSPVHRGHMGLVAKRSLRRHCLRLLSWFPRTATPASWAGLSRSPSLGVLFLWLKSNKLELKYSNTHSSNRSHQHPLREYGHKVSGLRFLPVSVRRLPSPLPSAPGP